MTKARPELGIPLSVAPQSLSLSQQLSRLFTTGSSGRLALILGSQLPFLSVIWRVWEVWTAMESRGDTQVGGQAELLSSLGEGGFSKLKENSSWSRGSNCASSVIQRKPFPERTHWWGPTALWPLPGRGDRQAFLFDRYKGPTHHHRSPCGGGGHTWLPVMDAPTFS